MLRQVRRRYGQAEHRRAREGDRRRRRTARPLARRASAEREHGTVRDGDVRTRRSRARTDRQLPRPGPVERQRNIPDRSPRRRPTSSSNFARRDRRWTKSTGFTTSARPRMIAASSGSSVRSRRRPVRDPLKNSRDSARFRVIQRPGTPPGLFFFATLTTRRSTRRRSPDRRRAGPRRACAAEFQCPSAARTRSRLRRGRARAAS